MAKPIVQGEVEEPFITPNDLASCGLQVGMGSLCGYVSGLAMKKFGTLVAYTLGTGFIILQSLQYSGYIQVNWRKVERDYVKILDVDRDGVVTSNDVNLWSGWLKEVLMFDLPAGVGFSGGWIMGLGGPTSLAGGVGTAGMLYGVGTRVVLPRVAMTTGATTGGPAVLVGMKEWWQKTKTTLGVASPEEMFRQTISDYDYNQLVKLQNQFIKETRRSDLLPFDRSILDMKQKVVAKRLEEVPPPPKAWWQLW